MLNIFVFWALKIFLFLGGYIYLFGRVAEREKRRDRDLPLPVPFEDGHKRQGWARGQEQVPLAALPWAVCFSQAISKGAKLEVEPIRDGDTRQQLCTPHCYIRSLSVLFW